MGPACKRGTKNDVLILLRMTLQVARSDSRARRLCRRKPAAAAAASPVLMLHAASSYACVRCAGACCRYSCPSCAVSCSSMAACCAGVPGLLPLLAGECELRRNCA